MMWRILIGMERLELVLAKLRTEFLPVGSDFSLFYEIRTCSSGAEPLPIGSNSESGINSGIDSDLLHYIMQL
jgi:hypothetical protein